LRVETVTVEKAMGKIVSNDRMPLVLDLSFVLHYEVNNCASI